MPNNGRSSSPHEEANDATSSFAQQVNIGGTLGDQDTQTTFCSSGSSSSEDENSTADAAPNSLAETAATSERRRDVPAQVKSLLGDAGDDKIVLAGTDFSSLEQKSNKRIIFPAKTMNENDTDPTGQGFAIAPPLDGQGEFSADGFPPTAAAKPLTPPPTPSNDVLNATRAAVGCPGGSSGAPSTLTGQHPHPPPTTATSTLYQYSDTTTGRVLTTLSKFIRPSNAPVHSGSALAGFLALLLVTAANYMLGPMRDAAALAVGVEHIPTLTLASTVLAIASSVPIGWLFEAPDPMRKKLWRKMGLTRGETQGTSLALFYRLFAGCLVSYALGFKLVEIVGSEEGGEEALVEDQNFSSFPFTNDTSAEGWSIASVVVPLEVLYAIVKAAIKRIVASKFGKLFYVAFFLVVHLMKLHSLSLIWGVTTEALEYEEQADTREKKKLELEAAATRQRELSRSRGKQQSQSATTLRALRSRLSTIPSGQIKYGDKEENGGPALAAVEETKNKKKRDAGQAPGTTVAGGGGSDGAYAPSSEGRSKARLKRLAFVGFGGTLGGISGSVIASMAAHVLHLSGLLLVAAIMLEMSAELSIELGRIMQRHWEEQNRIRSYEDLASLGRNADTSPHSGGSSKSEHGTSRSNRDEDKDEEEDLVIAMKRVSSSGSMKRVASGNSLYGEMRRTKSGTSLSDMRKTDTRGSLSGSGRSKTGAGSLVGVSQHRAAGGQSSVGNANVAQTEECTIDDNSFRQRLLRGITTILRSRLLMAIFTYNALYASTSVLLSFQRAELVANRSSAQESNSAESDTAFLAKINMASSVAVFVLQASGLGAYIAHSTGQRGTLALIPIIRLFGVLLLAWWHVQADGEPPNLLLFLVLDELTKVVNFAVAKPVRESLWRGLSNEARYEAKPIVDTLANRWGGGSAAFCVSLVNRVIDFTHLGERSEDGTRTLLGFPPVLFLCVIVAAWWAMVSADLGHIRHRIDLELKKLQ